MNDLGKRIRRLRKQKNKTLADLAGDKISVSMLSLIENNKSTPSMENLNYLASRLDINVSELVSDENNEFTKILWEKIDSIIKNDGYNNPELYGLIKTNLNQISKSVYGAKIYKTYAYLQIIKQNQDLAQHYIKMAEDIYRLHGMIEHVLETWIDVAMFQFASNNYTSSLEMLIEIKEKIDSEVFVVDSDSVNIRILHLLGTLYAAVGDLDLAKYYLEESINLSSKTADFSNTSETYRLRVIISIFESDLETCNTYIKKLDLLVKLTNNSDFKYSLYFLKMNYEYLINNEPLRILGLFESYKSEPNYDHKIIEEIYNSYIYLLVGIAYFKLEEYERALSYFQLVSTERPLANHPIDLCMRSELEAYKAHIFQIQGEEEKALEYSEIAMNVTKGCPNNPYKKFIVRTYHDIKKANGDLLGGIK